MYNYLSCRQLFRSRLGLVVVAALLVPGVRQQELHHVLFAQLVLTILTLEVQVPLLVKTVLLELSLLQDPAVALVVVLMELLQQEQLVLLILALQEIICLHRELVVNA